MSLWITQKKKEALAALVHNRDITHRPKKV